MSSIMTKAQAGRKLSYDEWEYLRVKNPVMYEKLREIEKAKIACARKFFLSLGTKDTQYHVTYRKVASYHDLMNMANSDSGD